MQAEAWPEPANADELHDALVWLGFLSAEEVPAGPGWDDWLAALARAAWTPLHGPSAMLWIAAERLPQFQRLAGSDARSDDRRARGALGGTGQTTRP